MSSFMVVAARWPKCGGALTCQSASSTIRDDAERVGWCLSYSSTYLVKEPFDINKKKSRILALF